MSMYDLAREITNEVMGEGTYEKMNATNPDPNIRAAANHLNTDHCADCGHLPGEHADTDEAPCEVPGCDCASLHYLCEHTYG